jgi:uncharacterized membrane protein
MFAHWARSADDAAVVAVALAGLFVTTRFVIWPTLQTVSRLVRQGIHWLVEFIGRPA